MTAVLVEKVPVPAYDHRDPITIARDFMRRFIVQGHPVLHFWQGQFYRWTGTHYQPMEPAALAAQAWSFLEGAVQLNERGRSSKPFKPTIAKVTGVIEALKAIAHLPLDCKPPCWIEGGVDTPADRLIAMSNGLLDVQSHTVMRHSPTFFTETALPYAFDTNSPAPTLWLQFLEQLWPGDLEAQRTLAEIFGYIAVGGTEQQKVFLVVGPKRSGKGTIARILRHMLGPENCCGPTLASLSSNFGLQPLIGKRVAIIADARLGSRADQSAIAERLLSISGEDALTIDRKFMTAWTGHLSTRFLILSNELPRLADASGALASRFIVLTLKTSFLGREDPNLTDRLIEDLPGILLWALNGWKRLKERGYFLQPKSSDEAVMALEDLGSPVSAFIRDRCEVGPGYSVSCADLYIAWTAWCQQQGRDHPGTAAVFGRDIHAALPDINMTNNRIAGDATGKRARRYEGIGLRD